MNISNGQSKPDQPKGTTPPLKALLPHSINEAQEILSMFSFVGKQQPLALSTPPLPQLQPCAGCLQQASPYARHLMNMFLQILTATLWGGDYYLHFTNEETEAFTIAKSNSELVAEPRKKNVNLSTT